MTHSTRRQLLQSLAAAAVLQGSVPRIGLCTGTYGMKTLAPREALELIANIGYDGVEISLLPGWPTDPVVFDNAARANLKKVLQQTRLALPSLLESLPLSPAAGQHQANLERLRRAAQMAHDLAPDKPPIVETVLGLKREDWDASKTRMAAELADWATVARQNDITLAIKPHAGQAMCSPERALWILRQVNSPSLRVIYDYSHMFIEGFELESSLRQLFPYTVFIALKDGLKNAPGHEFLLPGDGATDYKSYFQLLRRLNYQGYVGVEVSALIFRQPGYDPEAAARRSYTNLAPVMTATGVRPKRS